MASTSDNKTSTAANRAAPKQPASEQKPAAAPPGKPEKGPPPKIKKSAPPRPNSDKAAAPTWRRRLAVSVALVLLVLWLLPVLLAWTPLRNQPMIVALSGVNGTVSSGSASFGWFSPIVYRDVEIRDTAGNVVLAIDELRSELPLLHLASHPRNVGTFRLTRPQLALEMRPDGSNLEDVLAPMLNKDQSTSAPIGVGLEVIDGQVSLHDVATDDRWQIDSLQSTLKLDPASPLPTEWSLSGHVPLKGGPSRFALAYLPAGSPTKLAMTPSDAADSKAERVEAHIDPLPMSIFRSVLARAMPNVQITGLMSADFQYELGGSDAPRQLHGQLQVDQLALSGSELGHDVFHLASVKVPCQVTWRDRQIEISQLGIACDVGSLSIRGHTTLPDQLSPRTFSAWLRESFDVKGNLDLAKVAALLPDTLHVRQSAQINTGAVQLALSSGEGSSGHRWTGQITTSNITGTSGGRPVRWEQPVVVNFAMQDTADGPVFEQLDCQSNFIHITGAGRLDRKFSVDGACNLDQLAAELGQFLDLGDAKPSGVGQGTVRFVRDDSGAFEATASGEIRNFHLALPGKKGWSEALLAASLTANGQMPATSVTELDKLQVDITSAPADAAKAQPDRLSLQLLEPVTKITSLSAVKQWRAQARIQGDLARWSPRLLPVVDMSAWQFGGACDMTAVVASNPKTLEIQDASGKIQQLHAWGAGLHIDEPIVELKGSATWDPAKHQLKLDQPTLLSSTVSLAAKQLTWQAPPKGPSTLQGTITGQADLARLSAWTHDPKTLPGNTASGRLTGELNINQSGAISAATLTAAVDNFVVLDTDGSSTPTATPGRGPFAATSLGPRQPAILWQEKRLALSAGGKYDAAADHLKLDSLEVTSAALHAKAVGQIASLSGHQDADLKGQLDYDWQALGAILEPYLGRQVHFTGRQTKQFTLRGPLASVASADPAAAKDPYAWLKPLVAEGGIGWTTADIGGLKLGAGSVDARLADGTVDLTQPLAVSLRDGQTGQFMLAPEVRFSPGPAQVFLKQGPVAKQVRISPEMCGQWLKFFTPLVADASHSEGSVSIDLQGGRLPLGDLTGGDVAGKLTIHSAEIAPGAIVEPFAAVTQKIQAILSGKALPLSTQSSRPLVSFTPQGVDFRMVNHRMYHDRIEMKIGETVIRTRGSVGLADETLIMEAEVMTPQIAPLIGRGIGGPDQPVIRIPISGTLNKPKLDPKAIEQLVAQLVKNGARNVIRDGIDDIEGLIKRKP